MKNRVLIVDDDEQLLDILAILLETENYVAVKCVSGRETMQALRENTDENTGAQGEGFSAVLLDLRLGRENGLDLLPQIRELEPHVPIFMMTAHGDVDSAVAAFGHGANGYIKKPFEEGQLLQQLNQAVEAYSLKRSLKRFSRETSNDGASSATVRSLIPSRDPLMLQLLERVGTAARVSSNVVIIGESGTGKELIARALQLRGTSGNFDRVRAFRACQRCVHGCEGKSFRTFRASPRRDVVSGRNRRCAALHSSQALARDSGARSSSVGFEVADQD
jgi:DNA-binding NtrC family response regulator